MRAQHLSVIACMVAAAVAPVVRAAAVGTGTPTVSRIAGANRFDTSRLVSSATFGSPPVPIAFVARGDTYADALAGTPAAAADGGPMLLVDSSDIPPETAAELTRLRPGRIAVLGGPGAIADSVVGALKAYTTGSVTRLAGADRYATAAAISAATFSPGVGTAYVATDLGFADALAGGAAAGLAKAPILITGQNTLAAATAQELARLHAGRIVILGGTAVVSDAVASQLAAYTAGTVTRLAGADRYATAVAVSEASFPTTATAVYLATGLDFPDALAGGVAAALAPGPLLLVPGSCIPAAVSGEITRLGPSAVYLLGGTAALGPEVDTLAPCGPGTADSTPGSGGGVPQCTSDPQGSLGPFDYPPIVNSNGYNTYVGNNMWAANPGTTQTVCGTGPGNWAVTANAGPDGYTGVQTYPDVQQLMDDWTGSGWNDGPTTTDTPLGALHSLTSMYAITSPSVGDWEAAYDIWLDNTPNNEIMIWVYTSADRGTGGSTVVDTNVNVAGQSFTYMNYGGGLPILALNTNQASGTVDVLAALRYLQSIGQVSPDATLSQLDFGWEICNTSGQSLTFKMSNYSISAS
jgi:putative cell wall-binding protein